jgi:hypothetical protein
LAENWNDSRIGDGIVGILGRGGRTKVCERWPDGLLCKYMMLTDQANNISVLSDFVNQLKNTSHGNGSNVDIPGANTTVLHLKLKLGDGLCGQYDLGSWRGTRKLGHIMHESIALGK